MASERNMFKLYRALSLSSKTELNQFLFCCFPFLLDERICSPPFMILNADCSPDVLEQIKRQGLTFPFSKFCFYFEKCWHTSYSLIMIIVKELLGLRCRN